MAGRPKKDNSRDSQYRVRLNDDEEAMLNYASRVTGIRKSEIFRKALQEYYQNVKIQEYSPLTNDCEEWEDDRISLKRIVECPYCNMSTMIDLEDEADITSSERQMGPEILYEFNNIEFNCDNCHKNFIVKGYISEYPAGAFNSEEINVCCKEDENDD